MQSSKERYADYLQTDYWKAVEREVKRRADYRCQICNSQHDLQAHHRTYEHRGKELDHLGDLTCLCRRCHAIFHGQLVAVPEKPNRKVSFEEIAAQPGYLSKRARRELRRQSQASRTNIKPHTDAEIDAVMPAGEGDVTLTHELILKCRTTTGGFTSATLETLNPPDLLKGWPFRLVGKVLSRETFRNAVAGKYIYSSKRFQVLPINNAVQTRMSATGNSG